MILGKRKAGKSINCSLAKETMFHSMQSSRLKKVEAFLETLFNDAISKVNTPFFVYIDKKYIQSYNIYKMEVNIVGEKSYKIRRSGNSDVTTIPAEVKERLGVETGGAISYIFLEDGTVKIIKAEEKVDIDSIVDAVMDQYEDAIKDLIEL